MRNPWKPDSGAAYGGLWAADPGDSCSLAAYGRTKPPRFRISNPLVRGSNPFGRAHLHFVQMVASAGFGLRSDLLSISIRRVGSLPGAVSPARIPSGAPLAKTAKTDRNAGRFRCFAWCGTASCGARQGDGPRRIGTPRDAGRGNGVETVCYWTTTVLLTVIRSPSNGGTLVLLIVPAMQG